MLAKIRGWQSIILSFGGRAAHVKFVLQSLPIHIISAISPPKTTLKQIKSLTTDLFWVLEKDKKK